MGEATRKPGTLHRPSAHFNPRFPWGKRHPRRRRLRRTHIFQSTLPVGEATAFFPRRFKHLFLFQSTLPVGEATCAETAVVIWLTNFNPRFPWGKRPPPGGHNMNDIFISIHASRGGSDGLADGKGKNRWNFNPRFPWGKRLPMIQKLAGFVKFQSTLPVGEATFRTAANANGSGYISIHASRGGSDPTSRL